MAAFPSASQFPSTCWSRVISAGDPAAPGAREAFAELCRDYWYPLYAFIRRKSQGPEEALDLTQDYFARLLARGVVAAADPARGRFRSFLLSDCVHFLSHRREGDRALKRGGGVAIVSIDARDAEGRYLREPMHERTPERLFEHDWAVALLEKVLARLRLEYESSGRGAAFEVLKVVLTADSRAVPYAELALRLGTTSGAVQVAVHRLRGRYRALVREAIAATVSDESDIDDEIRALFTALGP
jgi:RNA polymerase sigma-70 factor (ECF subfamily)